MSLADTYRAIKGATVSIVATYPERLPQRPFVVMGSGFCIDPAGVIVTCEHVWRPFVDPESYQQMMEAVKNGKSDILPIKGMRPSVMFHLGARGHEVEMHSVGVTSAVTKTDYDLALVKIGPHKGFPNGYPYLQIEDFSELHEMMEIATCGFPLGEGLHDQLGTVTSSFTRGMMSAIIPAPGVTKEHCRGFQLDISATNGNSGGPVFSLGSGKVFGVLSAGAMHPNGYPIGLVKAEPIYPIFNNDLLQRIKNGLPFPPQVQT